MSLLVAAQQTHLKRIQEKKNILKINIQAKGERKVSVEPKIPCLHEKVKNNFFVINEPDNAH